jgi:hypothetical protein
MKVGDEYFQIAASDAASDGCEHCSECICKIWPPEPDRFILDRIDQMAAKYSLSQNRVEQPMVV